MSFKYISLLLVALVAVAIASESEVIVLTAENFDAETAKHPLLLVEFYAPWCGHCKKLAPEYDNAAAKLAVDGIHIAKIDADDEQNRPIAGRFQIRGFPTLKLFKNGAFVADYEGGRTTDAIVSFMKKQALPAITELSSAEQATSFSVSEKVVIIGFFENRDSAEYQTFKNAAEALRNRYLFGDVVGNSAINTELGAAETPSVVIFKKFDEGKTVLSKDNFADLAGSIRTAATPIIDEIGPENYKDYQESGLPLGYLFLNPAVDKEVTIAKVRPLADKTRGKVNWVWIDATKFGKHAERLGLSGKVVPAVSIDDKGLHFAFDESVELSAEALNQWIDKYLNKELSPTIRSEEIPASNDGPVKVVVAKNFDEIVMDSSKDVLVEFYAPWCGHCKQLAPTYEELGNSFKGTNVVIAKIDATANDVDPKFNIRGFPTIKFFPANDKNSPIDYEGDRSLDSLAKFVNERASTLKKDEL